MNEMTKAELTSDGKTMHMTLPISKIDEEKRTVSGFATLNNVDKQGDVLSSDASRKAFSDFRGNLRLMHQPIPAGKVTNVAAQNYFDTKTGKEYEGIFVDTYVSKGAPDVWEMVLDGTLTAFSIGGAIKEYDLAYDEDTDSDVRIVSEYELIELSLVDSPANQLANIFSIEKKDGDVSMSGMLSKTRVQNVFYCPTDKKAFTGSDEHMSCPFCRAETSTIGWVETDSPEEMSKSIKNLVKSVNSTDINDITEGGHQMSEVKTETVEKSEEPETTVENEEVTKSEESDTQEVVESTTDATLLEKFDGIMDRLDAIESKIAEYTEKVFGQIAEVEKSVTDTVETVEEVTKSFADTKTEFVEQAEKVGKQAELLEGVVGRVDAVESDTAIRKSAEAEYASAVPPIKEKSVWAGRFLTANELDRIV